MGAPKFTSRSGFQVVGTSATQGDDATGTALPAGSQAPKFRLERRAPVFGSLPFASLSGSILSHLGKPSITGATDARREPHTGVDFPLEYCNRTVKNCPSLAGIGVRTKNIVVSKVNVYSLGIYVDAAAAKKALGLRTRYKAQTEEQLAEDQKLFDEVVASETVDKSLRLVITSGLVNRKKFVDALEEQLKPRLAKAGHPELLQQFSSQFGTINFHKGLEVAFCQQGAGTLDVKIGGNKVGTIQSPVLCRALFDIYLGAEPVSKDAKASFGKSLAALLKEH